MSRRAGVSRTELPEHDVVGLRADNPGPFTLTGTNSWIAGRDPAWLIDPGPALEPHIEAIAAELEARGGLAGIALTHDHADHAEAVPRIRERFPDTQLAGARGDVDVVLAGGSRFGPFEAVETPGHAPDHLAFVSGPVAFTGDAVLGQGSVFVFPYPGALAGYLDGLERLRGREFVVILPGHGPVVTEPAAKLDEYVSHRLDRERRLVAALGDGKRSVDELLDDVWDDAPAELRPAAAWTLAAHLDKLEAEGRLPDGVERPRVSLPDS
jgi:glyoxylase-like metal-dependent hydrolase (beta-lactamase superfamily II)